MASITHLNIFNSKKSLPVHQAPVLKAIDILDIFTQSSQKMAESIVQQDEKEFLAKISASAAAPHLSLFSNRNASHHQTVKASAVPALKIV